MKLKNIAEKQGKKINLELMKDKRKVILPNQEFEVNDELGKELLEKTIDNKLIVEVIKEQKNKPDKEV